MAGYWFFLSYARRDDVGDSYVSRFHRKLAESVGRIAGLPGSVPPNEIGFLDTGGIEPEERWPDKLAAALQMSKVLVCLCSPAYFNSEYCGKELQAFQSRLAASTNASPPPIVPILWERRDRLPQILPEVLRKAQYARASPKRTHEEIGPYQLISLSRYRDDYKSFVDNIAGLIFQRANAIRLAPAAARPDPAGSPTAAAVGSRRAIRDWKWT